MEMDTEQETAFRRLQNELTSDRVMAYVDPKKPTEVLVDASPTGLGFILIQDGKVISYGSRALSDVETRYSQTERGKDDANPAHFISRHPDQATLFPDNIAEEYVNYLCNNIIPKAMTLSEVKKERFHTPKALPSN